MIYISIAQSLSSLRIHSEKMKQFIRDFVDLITPNHAQLCVSGYENYFKGKIGLEIGGPSFLWRKAIPIYKWAKRIDNYDFSDDAIRHMLGRGENKYCFFLHKRGTQYAGEYEFENIKSKNYDFVILRDVLEHTANPLKMLSAIHRVTKDGGALLVVTPNKLGTFDYARKYTTFRHLLEDYIGDTMENDETHFQEIKDLTHDHIDPAYTTREELHKIIDRNKFNRNAHHHVFSLDVLSRCCSEVGYRTVLATESLFPHTLVLGIKYPERNLRLKPSIQTILKYEIPLQNA